MQLGIDIGGTKICGVALGLDGGPVASHWMNHSARGIDDVLLLIAETVQHLLADPDADRADAILGVSVAGLVDSGGRVTRKGVLSLDGEDVAEAVFQACGLKAHIVNDAEATLRAAVEFDPDTTGARDAVLLALGTGVGGAVMWNGHLVQGRRGFAGELGHVPVLTPLEYSCVCGGYGCLEQFASGRGLAERAVSAATSGEASDLIEHAGVSPEHLTSVHVVTGAAASVPSAVVLIDDAARALAQAIIAISIVSEPSKIYLGGSLGHATADLLVPRIAKELERRWPFSTTWPPPHLVLDGVGRNAAAVGAALLVLDTGPQTPSTSTN